MNNPKSIIANPYENLTKTDIRLYYYLLNMPEWTNTQAIQYFILKQKETDYAYQLEIHASNQQLANIFDVAPETISRAIKRLFRNKLIGLKYVPSKYGVIRYIYISSTAINGQ